MLCAVFLQITSACQRHEFFPCVGFFILSLDCLLDHPARLVIPVHCLRPSKMFVVFQAQIHLEALRL